MLFLTCCIFTRSRGDGFMDGMHGTAHKCYCTETCLKFVLWPIRCDPHCTRDRWSTVHLVARLAGSIMLVICIVISFNNPCCPVFTLLHVTAWCYWHTSMRKRKLRTNGGSIDLTGRLCPRNKTICPEFLFQGKNTLMNGTNLLLLRSPCSFQEPVPYAYGLWRTNARPTYM